MSKLLIQIDELVREMTEEELAEQEAAQAAYVPWPSE